jgi:hypothetical protein
MTPVPNYILRTMAVGTLLGSVHGAVRGWRELRKDVPVLEHCTREHLLLYIVHATGHDAMYGAIFGPWAPVLIPAAIFSWNRQLAERCQYFKDKLQ